MKEYRVTNRTQGRLELKSIRRVLDAGESVVVAEPLPDDIKFKIGGGPHRLIDVKEITGPSFKKPVVRPSVSESSSVEPPRLKRRNAE